MSKPMRAVGLDFVDTAPVKLVFHAEVNATPEAVYAVLSGDPDGWKWFPTLTGGRFPDGRGEVGDPREVLVFGTKATETVMAADPGRRWAFRVNTLSLPLAYALIEDWVLTEVPATSTRPIATRTSYTFALDPRPLAARTATFSGATIGAVFAKAAKNLDKLLNSAG